MFCEELKTIETIMLKIGMQINEMFSYKTCNLENKKKYVNYKQKNNNILIM